MTKKAKQAKQAKHETTEAGLKRLEALGLISLGPKVGNRRMAGVDARLILASMVFGIPVEAVMARLINLTEDGPDGPRWKDDADEDVKAAMPLSGSGPVERV